jgi:hypothetical protein
MTASSDERIKLKFKSFLTKTMDYEYNSLEIRQKCLFSKNVFIQILQHIFFLHLLSEAHRITVQSSVKCNSST